jgi:hypothetical protein
MAYQDSPQCVRPGATMESGPELIRFMRKAHRPWRDDLRASHVRPPLPPFVSAAAQPNSAAAFLECWQPQDLLQHHPLNSARADACGRPKCRHAEATEHLADLISANARVLDVGSGSGYLLAVLWEMAKSGKPDGRQTGPRIVGIDHVQGASAANVGPLRERLTPVLSKP